MPLPLGAELIAPTSSVWRLGTTPVRTLIADGGARRVHLLGWCGATDAQVSALVDRSVPTDVAWRWPGNYAVVEENADNIVLHTDPVSAFPCSPCPGSRAGHGPPPPVCSPPSPVPARMLSGWLARS